jgi:glycerol-3-phosphate dehydrogenase (NAD(P)+)
MQRIAVIGAGAWGTALAEMLAQAGRRVRLWTRRPELAQRITASRENADYLPEVRLSTRVLVTARGADLADAELVLLVTPAQALGEVAAGLSAHLPTSAPVLICAKGIERDSLRLLSEVAEAALPGRPLAVLSGPTFAAEVARGLPTAVTLACTDAALGRRLVEAIGRPHFRPYLSDDLVGVQIGGAFKNVIAIACGIVDGRRLGENARAALMTRGLAEMLRFGRGRGARAETLMGLSGLGDLVLSCNSPRSRNMSLGIALGQGGRIGALLSGRRTVSEGVATAAAIARAAAALGLALPIAAAVDRICNHGAEIEAEVGALLARPFTTEGA